MSYLFMICFIFGFVESLDGPYVCDSKTRGKYCCSYFQEKNGKCIACGVGFISRFGSPCLPCNENLYGDRCIRKCKCTKDKKCDNVIGCVQKLHSTTQSIVDNLFVDESSVNLQSSSEHSVSGTTEMQSFESGGSDEFDLSKEQIHIVYSASVAGFILLLGMCYIGHKCRKKSSKKEIPKQENISLNNSSSSVHEYFEPNVNHYDIINDHVIIHDDQSVNPYLDVIINSSETTSESNTSSDIKIADSTGYLNLYQTLTSKDNSTVHVYNTRISYCNNINEPVYLKATKSSVHAHSYQTLADGCNKERNTYNKLSNVHKIIQHSRLYESDVIVFNQHEDVLESTDIDNIRRYSY